MAVLGVAERAVQSSAQYPNQQQPRCCARDE
jgi:hypothetical protein